jgi:hypothetical protein
MSLSLAGAEKIHVVLRGESRETETLDGGAGGRDGGSTNLHVTGKG